MPSNRKRIGFLPSEEVHYIIEKICIENKLSQSKVTGILVEESLQRRGALKDPFLNKEDETLIINEQNKDENFFQQSDFLINYRDIYNKNKKDLNENIKMINEFIEYKFFKEVMNQKQNELL